MGQFHIVRLTVGKEFECVVHNGEALVFDSRDVALAYADDRTRRTGFKYQIRPVVVESDWKAREQDRFDSKSYIKLPWHHESWVDRNKECRFHYPHVSRQDPANIAFTADETKGKRDLKTVMRASKYLTTYYGHQLNEEVIRYWVAYYKKLHDGTHQLKFAYTDKEIVSVYKNGPHSCMKDGLWRSKVHPASVYAGPDLAVAYVQAQGRITARTVVWPAKKLWAKIYGDTALLARLLMDEGYTQGELEGARLTKIKQGTRYVCPYIDNTGKVKVGVKYLRISKKGKRHAANQDGFCGQGFRCALCREQFEVHKAGNPQNYNGAHACNPCIEAHVAAGTIFRCVVSEQYFPIAFAARMYNGDLWHRTYTQNIDYGFHCPLCAQNYPRNMGSIRSVGGGQQMVCHNCRPPEPIVSTGGYIPGSYIPTITTATTDYTRVTIAYDHTTGRWTTLE